MMMTQKINMNTPSLSALLFFCELFMPFTKRISYFLVSHSYF